MSSKEEVIGAAKVMHKSNCDRDSRYFSGMSHTQSDSQNFNRTMISVKSGVSIPGIGQPPMTP